MEIRNLIYILDFLNTYKNYIEILIIKLKKFYKIVEKRKNVWYNMI